jgi:hypothetical protein
MKKMQTRSNGQDNKEGHIIAVGKVKLMERCSRLGEIHRDWYPLLSFYNFEGKIYWVKDRDPRGIYSPTMVWTELRQSEQRPLKDFKLFISVLSVDAAHDKDVIVRMDFGGTHYFSIRPKQIVHVLDPRDGSVPLEFVKRCCPMPWQFFAKRQVPVGHGCRSIGGKFFPNIT